MPAKLVYEEKDKIRLFKEEDGRYFLEADGFFDKVLRPFFIHCKQLPKMMFFIEKEQILADGDEIPEINLNIVQFINTKLLSDGLNDKIREELGLPSLKEIRDKNKIRKAGF